MGKTAVFTLSTLQQLEPKAGKVSALVLCHTRELAFQICHEFERFSVYMSDVKVAVIFGGVPRQTHVDMLKNDCPHIVVGTPGRILDLANSGDLDLSNLDHFIIDECDKVLETLDMRKDVQSIFVKTPHKKQVMMFSATLSKEIRPVCKKFMSDPMEVYVDDDSKLTLHGLVQHYITLSENESPQAQRPARRAEFNQVVICEEPQLLPALQPARGVQLLHLHLLQAQQDERLARYKTFKEGHKRILVATDMFGRGIDIERVNIVINYDMPKDANSYLHRWSCRPLRHQGLAVRGQRRGLRGAQQRPVEVRGRDQGAARDA